MSAHIRDLAAATGKYQLADEIHEGANAYAFRARHLPLQREVFLKVYDVVEGMPGVFDEPQVLVAATSGATPHPNLVRVFDAERLGSDYALMAMEYVPGGSLLSRLPLPMMDAVRCAIGILHGVARLHSGDILHRDIKPGNVVVARNNGDPLCPKLTDFGSAVQATEDVCVIGASRHSALYVPPEGWGHPSRFDRRSDLYQVGLVLYEMIHGPLPYHNEAYLDVEAKGTLKEMGLTLGDLGDCDQSLLVDACIARRAKTAKIRALRPSAPYVPRRLTRIVNKAMAPDPEERYQAAAEMIADLEAIALPNFERDERAGSVIAKAWRGYDWSVCPTTTSAHQVTRTKPSGRTRRWKSPFPSIKKAAKAISEFKRKK